ncbi:SDR family oxidoreductase [Gordonia sp. (in: high G+C Gram-positive bacteria)]|uniref:SDR family oxidoreductase n=1 Tax=Gordonia sp. (in: high G+C Gram-positive bacteria) TaxID=84139 RepID=UPI003F950D25
MNEEVGLGDARVVIVTGAGQGIGRAHALAFAAQGVKVVVNDYAAESAESVAAEIAEAGGEAAVAAGDVADWDTGAAIVQTAIDSFGRLDALVNNAGFLRDRMLVSLSEEEWDSVVRVHLKGHFVMLRHAAAYWRGEAKAGRTPRARIVNTSSGAGIFGSVGQGNYAAAKAGIAELTIQAAAELGGYGITVNAIAPSARTQMTLGAGGEMAEQMAAPADGSFDAMDPANISPLVVWLASADAGEISGRLFEVEGGVVTVLDGWQRAATADNGARWEQGELSGVVPRLVAQSPDPVKVYGSR